MELLSSYNVSSSWFSGGVTLPHTNDYLYSRPFILQIVSGTEVFFDAPQYKQVQKPIQTPPPYSQVYLYVCVRFNSYAHVCVCQTSLYNDSKTVCLKPEVSILTCANDIAK